MPPLGLGGGFDPSTIPSQAGKVILVTGGNTGLGLETIRVLSAHSPAHIYLCARSAASATAALATLHASHPHTPITHLPLDLADLSSVQSCARAFTAASPRLDILLCNAGVMALPPGLTAQGYELQFGTNHVGHALLTKLLLPTLTRTAEAGADVRVVFVASVGHWWCAWRGGIDFATLKSAGGCGSTWARYGMSKLANIVYARQLAARVGPGVCVVSVHPGVVDTGLRNGYVGRGGWMGGVLDKVWGVGGTGVQTGALNQLWAATAEGVVGGEYYGFGRAGWRGGGSWWTRDEGLGERLWEWTERELEGYTL